MKALLENIPLLQCSGRKIGVFGQMREQGSVSPAVHAEVGELAGRAGFQQIYFTGEDHGAFSEGLKKSGFKGDALIAADFKEDLGQALESYVKPGDIVVIKGSRGTKMERFIPFLHPINWSAK
jgi:UDP-N-acetylmuramoyl-tripeptide--D-alanyl-D-alanine ligase